MVQVSNENNEITIKLKGDAETLVDTQKALIDLMRCFNYESFGSSTTDIMPFALDMLEALLPDTEQQQRGLINKANYLELPENINNNQRQTLKEALKQIEHPEVTIRSKANHIFTAIEAIKA